MPDVNSVLGYTYIFTSKLPKQKQSFVLLFHEILGNDNVKQKQAQSSKDEAWVDTENKKYEEIPIQEMRLYMFTFFW